MKYLLLITFSAVLFFQEGIIEKRKSQIIELSKTLEIEKTINYSFVHLEGRSIHFINSDGSKSRIIMDWDRGSYGSEEREYFTLEEKLIYFKTIGHSWVDSSQYYLSETIYYFSDDKTGLKTRRQINTYGEDLKNDDLEILKNSIKDTTMIDADDYNRLIEELSYLKTKQVRRE